MSIDIVSALIVLSMAYFGYVTGTFFQLLRAGVLGLAGVLAYVICKEMAIFHVGKSSTLAASEAVTYWFFICLGVLWGVGTVAVQKLAGDARDASIDRTASDALGGAVLGGLRGAAIAVMLVLGMHTLDQTQQRFNLPYDYSKVFKIADKNNFLRLQTRDLQRHLDTHFTTDPAPEEDRVKSVGGLPADERELTR